MSICCKCSPNRTRPSGRSYSRRRPSSRSQQNKTIGRKWHLSYIHLPAAAAVCCSGLRRSLFRHP